METVQSASSAEQTIAESLDVTPESEVLAGDDSEVQEQSAESSAVVSGAKLRTTRRQPVRAYGEVSLRTG